MQNTTSVVGRQPVQTKVEAPQILLEAQLLDSRRLRVGDLELGDVAVAATARHATERVEGTVAQDRHNPRSACATRPIECRRPLPDLDERLMEDVGGQIPSSQHPERNTEKMT